MEFALVSPVLMALLIGLLEGGMLLFSAGSVNFAASEAARAAAEKGNAVDADTWALSRIRNTAIGTTAVLQVDEIDIYRVVPTGGGNFAANDSSDIPICGGQCINRYTPHGTLINGPLPPWDPDLRRVTNSNADYLAVTIQARYNWLTGIFSDLGPVYLSPTYYVRLEPQTY